MERAGDILIYFKPDYIIGYSVALDRLARANAYRKDKFQKLGVKVCIGAAEAFPASDTEKLLSELFNCPVGMEYGSVETALIAHTHPEGGYKVFWRSYLVDAERDSKRLGYKIRVTSLYPRCFPLIRYEIGDEIMIQEANERIIPSVKKFNKVLGRCNDYVELRDGSLIHSEAFTHAIRWCQTVSAYQIIQNREYIYIHYTAKEPLDKALKEVILKKLQKVHPLLTGVELVHVNELKRTIAGKTLMVIRMENN
jgi:phenylacetate-coenzyme A ligase PaaK-like adenylate-forming protein